MSHLDYTIIDEKSKEGKNKHLSKDERIKIEIYLKEGHNATYIANEINRSARTIQNEISRNKIIFLSKKPCIECRNYSSCNKVRNCEVFKAYGNCKQCTKCEQNICKDCSHFTRKGYCKESINCNACDRRNRCRKTRVEYHYDAADNRYTKKRQNSVQIKKILKSKELENHIRRNIKVNKYCPDTIAGRLNLEGKFKIKVSSSTIYRAINDGIIEGVSNFDLPRKLKFKDRRKKEPIVPKSIKHRENRTLADRPKEASAVTTIGHKEMDLVEGIKGGELLLTIIDRYSSQLIIEKIKDKTQKSVKLALDRIEKRYGESFKNIFKTITTDNGKEFTNIPYIEESCLDNKIRTKVYYTMPYSSWEKGKIEQCNSTIRKYIPKGIDMSKFSYEQIKEIESKINNMPRKRLGYLTANETTELAIKQIA